VSISAAVSVSIFTCFKSAESAESCLHNTVAIVAPPWCDVIADVFVLQAINFLLLK